MREKTWLCITEDKYLKNTFFDTLNRNSRKDIKVYGIGCNDNFKNNLLFLLNGELPIKSVLDDIKDDVLNEYPDITDEELETKIFGEYVDLYQPFFFYFFDMDRLYPQFYKTRGTHNAKVLVEKLKMLILELSQVEGLTFYLVPSYPSLATFAYLIECFCEEKDIYENIGKWCKVTDECRNPMKVTSEQQYKSEVCVQCIISEMIQPKRFYKIGEKKYFDNKNKYKYLGLIENKEWWHSFYQYIKPYLEDILKRNSIMDFKINNEILDDLLEVKEWYSVIPFFIEAVYYE